MSGEFMIMLRRKTNNDSWFHVMSFVSGIGWDNTPWCLLGYFQEYEQVLTTLIVGQPASLMTYAGTSEALGKPLILGY